MSHDSRLVSVLRDAHISLAMRPVAMRGGIDLAPLPPSEWEEVRLRLQDTYRLATGEKHAILIVTSGEASP